MATIRCIDRTFNAIEAIVFDKDGTLAQSEAFLRNLAQRRSRLIDAQIPGVQEPLLMAFGADSTQINPAGLMAVGSRRDSEIAAAAYVAETGRDWLEALEIVQSAFREADHYMKDKAAQTPLVAGALELLQRLSQAGVKLGILSADSPEQVAAFVQTHGLDPYITAPMGMTGDMSKLDPACFRQICERLGVSPGVTLVVGDSAVDVQLARLGGAAGSIGMTGGWSAPFPLKADVVVRELGQIQVV